MPNPASTSGDEPDCWEDSAAIVQMRARFALIVHAVELGCRHFDVLRASVGLRPQTQTPRGVR